ncbi:MAG TPA: DUF4832 domain-containing protein [Candidatus Ventricola intestinavium]|nr:DUF4832 domain-containing protein [Candidatus Ventricola intestinavium]
MKKGLAVLLLLAASIWLCACQRVDERKPAEGGEAGLTVVTQFPAYTGELVNPFIGNLAWADDTDEHEQPFTLVYANMTWAQIEPEEGVYAFEAFEEAMHVDMWRDQCKHMVLRFVMDIPGDRAHADLPAWLMEKTQGRAYSCEYGQGYCPDYTDETLIQAHERVIQALAQRYDGDPFVAYVELGSLGHWGEWHVHEDAGNMPLEEVRDRYAQAYLDAFDSTFLMMRRPFRFAAAHQLGLYNDTAGRKSSTETWLGWIDNGGVYDVTGEEDALSPMPDGWKDAPVGGELATSMEPEEMLRGEQLATTLDLFERSHASWIGPGSFKDVERGGEDQPALDALMSRIGYRIRVTQAAVTLEESGAVSLTLTFTNDGIAPFYFDWQPCVRLIDAQGTAQVLSLDLSLPDLLPGEAVSVKIELPQETRTADVGIVDPATGEPGVQLAMQAEHEGNWYRVMRLER